MGTSTPVLAHGGPDQDGEVGLPAIRDEYVTQVHPAEFAIQ